ncbi:hypothetical protein C8F04DRAFT_1341837 [Mycena alexandri]|uniref:Cell wall protein n=1 Tax=Mycena alexandri TaxID=1745969 RepID=A0AAD6WKA1_9AGAR|nr:hypothetical protein C8F04DRAFT_1341837 [Mycena alexandri]
MARVLLALVSVALVAQTLAAPHHRRALPDLDCGEFGIQADSGISTALNAFASIKSSSDPNLLAAKGSLTAADSANRQFSTSLQRLDAQVLSGLQASLASLAKVQPDDSIKAAVALANTTMTAALDAAQKQAADPQCQPVAFVAPPPTSGPNLYSMVSGPVPPSTTGIPGSGTAGVPNLSKAVPTTTLRTGPSFTSSTAPEATSLPAAAPANDAVVGSTKSNGAMSVTPYVSMAGAIALGAIISFF